MNKILTVAREGLRLKVSIFTILTLVLSVFLVDYNLNLTNTLKGINSANAVSPIFGSITICKYSTEDFLVSGWEIVLDNIDYVDDNLSQYTGLDGCYTFENLISGTYRIYEGSNFGLPYRQIQPGNPLYFEVEITENEQINRMFINEFTCGNSIVDIDTGETCDDGNLVDGDGCSSTCQTEQVCGNGFLESPEVCDDGANNGIFGFCNLDCTGDTPSICGNNIVEYPEECDDGSESDTCTSECTFKKGSISGCKYNDENGNGLVDSEEEKLENWEIQLIRCSLLLLPEDTLEFKPKGDFTSQLPGACTISDTTFTNFDGCYSFDNLDKGDYGVSEVTKDNWIQTFPENDTFYYFDLKAGENEINKDFLNYQEPLPNYQCSDEFDNDGDNLIDEFDPGCWTDLTDPQTYVPTDDNEYNSPISEGDVIINELMWMGSSDDIGDEWVELKNMTDSSIDDLGGCKLYKKGGEEIADLSALNIDSSYLVVSRKDQIESKIDTVSEDILKYLALSNTDLEISLYCGQTLIDVVGDGNAPLAGDNGDPKRSMSRKISEGNGTLSENWCSAITRENWDVETTEFGTPGTENVCNLISGHKFNDLNNNGIWDDGEEAITGWEIELYSSLANPISTLINTFTTLSDGYYEFKNLIAETYFVKEINQQGWQQTIPTDPDYYEIVLSDNEASENNDFGNYQEPVPSYQCSDGFDNDDDGWIDIDDSTCHSDSDYTNPDSYIPEKDTEQNASPVITLSQISITINTGTSFNPMDYATADDAEDGDITNDIIPTGSVDVNTPNTYFVDYNVVDSENEPAEQKTLEVIVITQGCVSNCGGGGTTVITKPAIIITNEKVEYLGDGKAEVTWTTNIETTEQIAYGDDSISTLGSVPEYGYDSVNDESNFMTKEHSVTIAGLTDGIPYYFRPIADRSGSTGEKVGIEVFYEPGEVKGVEAPEETPEQIPEQPCNYLLEYIKLGTDNNPVEVKKLETFLNVFEGENLAVNGIYEQVDFDAVSRFQEKYLDLVLSPWSHNSSTGYVYITTKKRINEIYCQKEFPLTSEQESEVSSFSSRFLDSLLGPEQDQPQESEEEDSSEQPQEENGEVAGAEDEVTVEDEATTEDEETDENGETQEDVLLIGEDKDDEEATEDGSIIQSFKNFSLWTWLLILIVFGAVTYYFLFVSKGKKKDEEIK
ncbi:MAG: DUF5011 domain-containing protein [Candidatus Pacebacteria bacterium]|nr:DUF5011 domain-containing protein [Candidatus Paceibacterota bacterium]